MTLAARCEEILELQIRENPDFKSGDSPIAGGNGWGYADPVRSEPATR
jgi:hypothetical protein